MCAHEDSIATENIEWSLAEREKYGLLTLWKYDPTNVSATTLLATIPYVHKVSRLLQTSDSSTFIVGGDNGEVTIYSKDALLSKSMVPVFSTRENAPL